MNRRFWRHFLSRIEVFDTFFSKIVVFCANFLVEFLKKYFLGEFLIQFSSLGDIYKLC